VTLFAGVYDSVARSLTYAKAGHHPPRIQRCSDGSTVVLDAFRGLPIGVLPDQRYEQAVIELVVGDQMILFTDGLTEAFGEGTEMYGLARLDRTIADCGIDAHALVAMVEESLDEFTHGRPPAVDVTLLAAKVRA
jgi:sigma-B regulation protein RsbU (phosphoserine phosphatase)